MNNPNDMPIDIEEMQAWLRDYRARHPSHSWSVLEKLTGRSGTTLSLFMAGKYQGRNDRVAEDVFRFRQTVEMKETREEQVLATSNFIETETARRLLALMEWSQMGRICVAAGGPGIGKTKAAKEYKARGSNVWLATMRQSTRTVTAMIAVVMDSMGLHSKSGWTQQRSGQVIDFVRGREGLLIVDEANNLDLPAFEELRALHDETGVGLFVQGNEELVTRIKGGQHSHAYARLNSRIAKFHLQNSPTEGDVHIFCDAMNVPDDKTIRRLLVDAALSPGHGGLREVHQILESAQVIALGCNEGLSLQHIQAAIADRFADWRRRAA